MAPWEPKFFPKPRPLTHVPTGWLSFLRLEGTAFWSSALGCGGKITSLRHSILHVLLSWTLSSHRERAKSFTEPQFSATDMNHTPCGKARVFPVKTSLFTERKMGQAGSFLGLH